MQIFTESVIINAPANKVFNYLAKYENIVKWSVNFISKLEKKDKGYFVTTPMGVAPFKIISDNKIGVVDLVIGKNPSPTRVIPLGEQISLYLFTLIFPPQMPRSEIEKGLAGLREELQMLKKQIEAQS